MTVSTRFGLRPSVYTFRDSGGRVTYVGMSMTSPGDRIKAHFDERRGWALEAAVIEVEWLPVGTPRWRVLELERARIDGLRPLGNRAGNRAWRRGWERRVRVEHARAAGVGVGWGELVGCWWDGVVWRAGRVVRWVGGLVVVDVVLRVVWHAVT